MFLNLCFVLQSSILGSFRTSSTGDLYIPYIPIYSGGKRSDKIDDLHTGRQRRMLKLFPFQTYTFTVCLNNDLGCVSFPVYEVIITAQA